MSTLRIQFAKDYYTLDDVQAPIEVSGAGKLIERRPIILGQGLDLEVPKGKYVIRLMMPSGEIITERADVGDEVAVIQLQPADVSPHESVASGHHLYGRAPSELSDSTGISKAPRHEKAQPKLRAWRQQPTADSSNERWFADDAPGKVSEDTFVAATDQHLRGAATVFCREGVLNWLQVQCDPYPTRFVALPGIRYVHVTVRDNEQLATSPDPLTILVRSRNERADGILHYLSRGAFADAEIAGTDFVQMAEALVSDKLVDPFGTAVGGYLLLRAEPLQQFNRWIAKLDTIMSWLPDGAIIHAWHLRQQLKPDMALFRDRLLEADRRGLPLYTQGVRLLVDGLRLLNRMNEKDLDVEDALARVSDYAAAVDWSAPTTTFYADLPYKPHQLFSEAPESVHENRVFEREPRTKENYSKPLLTQGRFPHSPQTALRDEVETLVALEPRFRYDPHTITSILRNIVPVLDIVQWSVISIEPGFVRSELPLPTDQHITYQAALLFQAADYTGGIAVGSLFPGRPLLGIHPVAPTEKSTTLWLVKGEIKHLRPSVGRLEITAEIEPERRRRIKKRYEQGKTVLETVTVRFRNGSVDVAEASMIYYVRQSEKLRSESVSPDKVSTLYEHKLISSAELIAGVRARESGRLFDDPFAARMAGEHGLALAARFCETMPQLGGMVAARTRHMDLQIQEYIRHGGRDLVLVGAGYDMRPFRLNLPGGMRVYELDLPPMLADRQRRLENLGVKDAQDITRVRVPIDLRTTSVADALRKRRRFYLADIYRLGRHDHVLRGAGSSPNARRHGAALDEQSQPAVARSLRSPRRGRARNPSRGQGVYEWHADVGRTDCLRRRLAAGVHGKQRPDVPPERCVRHFPPRYTRPRLLDLPLLHGFGRRGSNTGA